MGLFGADTKLARRNSGLTAVGDVGSLVDARGYNGQSATASTSWGALAATVAGNVGTAQVFRTIAAQAILLAGRWSMRVPWTLTAQSADAAARGTVQVTLSVGGVAVGTAQGAARNLNDANGTQYTELLALDLTTPVLAKAGEAIQVSIQPVITVPAGAGTYTPTLRHDPSTIPDQLAIELGSGG